MKAYDINDLTLASEYEADHKLVALSPERVTSPSHEYTCAVIQDGDSASLD